MNQISINIKIIAMYMFNKILRSSFFLILLNSCLGQSANVDKCKTSYKKARENFNSYYKNNDQSLIQEALPNAEQAIQCEQTKYAAIDLKISLLILLKKYKNGHEFIDSLSENDFKVKYKKKMYYNYFIAMEYESNADTVNRDKFLNEIVNSIQNYILAENMPKDKLDEEAYYTLYTIKKRLSSLTQLNNEIDLLKQKYPYEKDFFDALKETLNGEEKSANPIF